ncbi:hypothetical protein PHMEG_00031079 [Phytophthora megakarya]|uniref:Uncharacterized protein n=1 Tax=Phytophthora megakarya TaxID=4795 RepID=A0A225UZJ2_9STRA|nr:hypothetical protein PHMEG_00031079 [Phytophthora megakarya]
MGSGTHVDSQTLFSRYDTKSTHLQKRLSNRGNRNHSLQSEVFLDESYCNVNHVAGKTWLSEDKFTKLNITLKQYREFNLHVDGVNYHKRQEDPAPTRSSLKADIQTWLFRHGEV